MFKYFLLCLIICVYFPECVARFPFHSGGLGVEGVFARCCRTVRNRPREVHMAVHLGSSAEGVLFAGFKRLVAFRFAWQAWHFVTFRRVL